MIFTQLATNTRIMSVNINDKHKIAIIQIFPITKTAKTKDAIPTAFKTMPSSRGLADHRAGARQVRCYYYRIIKKINLVCSSREIIDFIRLAVTHDVYPAATGDTPTMCIRPRRGPCVCVCERGVCLRACVRARARAFRQGLSGVQTLKTFLRRFAWAFAHAWRVRVRSVGSFAACAHGDAFLLLYHTYMWMYTDCGGLWGALRQVDGGRRRPGGGGDAALVRGAARRRGLATAARLRMRQRCLVLAPHHKRYHTLK